MTPDGVARLVLDRLPLSQAEVSSVNALFLDDLHSGRERYYQPGDDLTLIGQRANGRLRLLQEILWVVPALECVVDRLSDEQLVGEVRGWLHCIAQLD
ncbi:hypothetical protein AC230_01520 [Streptomyces caatingaensis]|uniref:Uncharacterized protein n=1 Tax=Streptomyces caatingaensis TaxID=1678637 RepID=A0A0K9XJ41_9ACTN|nr:hypothetical protein AC230_01520 [Streptomyces caatingaensis]